MLVALRSIVKRLCPWLVPWVQAWRRGRQQRRLAAQSRKAVFGSIYQQQGWGPGESVSGAGSSLVATEELRRGLPGLLETLGVQTLLDCPCGDLHWIRQVPLPIERYIGGDIVPELIARLSREAAAPGRSFLVLDLIQDPLPPADALLCRDCLIHLSDEDALAALRNFARSPIRWLLTTHFPECPANEPIVTGEFRQVNLCRPPFLLPPPRYVLDDRLGRSLARQLAVWERSQMPPSWLS